MATKKDLTSAAAATAKFFSDADDNQKRKRSEKEDKDNVKKVFSFRASATDVASWRLYATAARIKVDDLGSRALAEYIDRHPLDDVQQAFFDNQLNKNMNS